jgi:hypothetical protein
MYSPYHAAIIHPAFSDVRSILSQARQRAFNAVNTAMVEAYWLIGKRIVEEEQHGNERAFYGAAQLKGLSEELQKEFGKGFTFVARQNASHLMCSTSILILFLITACCAALS